MIDRSDLLTWQGLRNLATCEAFNLADGIAIIPPKPGRPPIILESPGMRRKGPSVWMHLPNRIEPEPGGILYARDGWRSPWRGQIAALPVPIVLITAFHDRAILPAATAELFAGSVQTWYGVQVQTTHPQLVPMPVGVDNRQLPWLQEAQRQETRDILLYLNFQLGARHHEVNLLREYLWRYFSARPWVVADPWAKACYSHYYAQLGRSRFVLSPPGYGWDCYRTYDAIAMGAIPIVQRKRPTTDVCESLPVLVVDTWDEVTEERLASEWEKRRSDAPSLSMTYWRDRIRGSARAIRTSTSCAS